MLQVQEKHEQHEEYDDSEILAIEKAENETKTENIFFDLEGGDVDQTDLESEIYVDDDLDDWVLLDHESVVFWYKNQKKKYEH